MNKDVHYTEGHKNSECKGDGNKVIEEDIEDKVCHPCEEEEAEGQLAVRTPAQPTQAEREEHELTHFPYRSWCDHCVRGRAKDDPHRTVKGQFGESSIPRVILDYCFLSEDVQQPTQDKEGRDAGTTMTVLAMVETMCLSVWAYTVEAKGGTETWVADQIAEDLQTIGVAEEKVIVKSDQESSIVDLAKEIARSRPGVSTALETSKVGDSNSNGKVERAIQDLKGLIRTLRSALEEKIQQKIKLDNPVVPWLVRHAGHLITKCRVRENGRTSYQMMKGRRSNAKLVPFGETVLFKIPKTQYKIGSFEDRWEQGIWVGFVMRSGEHLVATEKGVFKVSTVLRRAADKRWSAELIGKIGGSPQNPVPGMNSRKIPAFARKYESEKTEQAVYVPVSQEAQEVRAAYIYKADVDKHGATPKCPGCKALMAGARWRARHTPECRKRFEELLSGEDGGTRFEAARKRRAEADAHATQRIVDASLELESKRLNRTVDESTIGKPEAEEMEVTIDPPGSRGGGDGDVTGSSAAAAAASSSVAATGSSSPTSAAAPASGAASTPTAPRPSLKRTAEEPADDSDRLNRDMDAQTEVTQGVKRKGDDDLDDSDRMKNRPQDMSTLHAEHPGQAMNSRNGIAKEDLEWKHIGSGIIAKTFKDAKSFITTSKNGPAAQDVYRRVTTNLRTGKIIDDCIVDDVADDVLHRRLPAPESIRVELTMRGAEKMFDRRGVDVAEVYSRPRVVQEAALRSYDGTRLEPGWSLDLTLNDPTTGRPWDLSCPKVQSRVKKMVVETRPFLLVGSPPCTMFSTLQALNKNKRDKKQWDRDMEAARKHMKFCMDLYMIQIRNRRFFLHEHPHAAASWKLPEVIRVMAEANVDVVECDMCAFGLIIKDGNEELLARKRTKLMSNSPEVLKRCARRCSNEPVKRPESGARSCAPTDEAARPKLHRHAELTGGKAKQCQVYPREFCRAVSAGIAAQKRLHSLGLGAVDLMNLEEINNITEWANPSGDLHEADGEMVAYDDQSGAPLKPERVAQARKEEIEYFKTMGVYEKVDIQKCWDETGKNPIAVRWVDINKGDEQNPNYRSRLVAKEFRDDVKPELYAPTPPGECLRLMLSRLASDRRLKLLYADVSRAYFYAKAVRPVYVKLPDEDREAGEEGKCGRLLMSMYGTRDAAVNWSAEYTATLEKDGYTRGVANSCLFYNKDLDVTVMVHGDDFIAVGLESQIDKTKDTLQDKYKLKTEKLGAGKADKKEVRILNKVVRYTTEGVKLEADPRHAEIVVQELGLQNAKSAKSPGCKEDKKKANRADVEGENVDSIHVGQEDGETEDLNECIRMVKARYLLSAAVVPGDEEASEEAPKDEVLEPDQARRYRAVAARLNYLAADRVDIQYAVKEAARAMSSPRTSHWAMLNRIGRYLVGRPRLVVNFNWQPRQSLATAFTDSDWAGCAKTARSTSGGIITLGSHVIKTYSRQQKTVALSSAEAELYAMVAASAESLAIIAYSRDLGMKLEGELYTDSSAALGISQRAGIGKVRHLRTQGLWVQEARITGRLQYKKILGTKNPADVLTKHVPRDLLDRHLETIGVSVVDGRAESAPELNVITAESDVHWYVVEPDTKRENISWNDVVDIESMRQYLDAYKPAAAPAEGEELGKVGGANGGAIGAEKPGGALGTSLAEKSGGALRPGGTLRTGGAEKPCKARRSAGQEVCSLEECEQDHEDGHRRCGSDGWDVLTEENGELKQPVVNTGKERSLCIEVYQDIESDMGISDNEQDEGLQEDLQGVSDVGATGQWRHIVGTVNATRECRVGHPLNKEPDNIYHVEKTYDTGGKPKVDANILSVEEIPDFVMNILNDDRSRREAGWCLSFGFISESEDKGSSQRATGIRGFSSFDFSRVTGQSCDRTWMCDSRGDGVARMRGHSVEGGALEYSPGSPSISYVRSHFRSSVQ